MKRHPRLILTLALALGCAAPEAVPVSSSLPATEGELDCAEAENGNTSVDLKVKHMAKPERLTPPASVYVVWTRAGKNAPAQNIGALIVDDALTGRLRTVSPLHRFELFVTAEASGQAQTPSGEPLVWASCQR